MCDFPKTAWLLLRHSNEDGTESRSATSQGIKVPMLAPGIITCKDVNKHQVKPHLVGKGDVATQILQCIQSRLRRGRNSENLRNSQFRNTRFLKARDGIIRISKPLPLHLTTTLNAYFMQFYSPGISCYTPWKIWKGILKGKKQSLKEWANIRTSQIWQEC